MKKTTVALIMIVFSTVAFAQNQEIKVSGLAKTGIYWEEIKQNGLVDPVPKVELRSKNDDAGDNQGRFQLDVDYLRENMGIKTRMRWDQWNGSLDWTYAFAYGDFFDDQLTFAVGKLGASPWGSGGPEMWKELEVSTRSGGMRTEIKPKFLPGLNVGFVLNSFNEQSDAGTTGKEITLLSILQESVVGISYTHDFFHMRFAYRFDSELDERFRGMGITEDELLYRVEERALTKVVPGLQFWALGYFSCVSANDPKNSIMTNWFFLQYEPPQLGTLVSPFQTYVRVGYDWTPDRSLIYLKPAFYWKFFNNLFYIGTAFSYGQDYGTKKWEGSPYSYIEFEPKIQFNFGRSYVAFLYNWRREYVGDYDGRGTFEPIRQTQWINLRFCMQM